LKEREQKISIVLSGENIKLPNNFTFSPVQSNVRQSLLQKISTNLLTKKKENNFIVLALIGFHKPHNHNHLPDCLIHSTCTKIPKKKTSEHTQVHYLDIIIPDGVRISYGVRLRTTESHWSSTLCERSTAITWQQGIISKNKIFYRDRQIKSFYMHLNKKCTSLLDFRTKWCI